MDSDDLISSEDLTQILDISPDSLTNWIEQGFLKPVTVGDSVRFHVEDIQALVANHPDSRRPASRLLIIEDDSLVGNSLRALLEKAGFEVTVIPIGLAVLESKKPV